MTEYSVEICKTLEQRFLDAGLYRPMRINRYDPGTELTYDIETLKDGIKGQVRLVIEKFVGGGFAGQVYRVKVTEVNSPEGQIEEIQAGGIYAMKILVPPSGFARIFRNVLYRIGFQAPFQLQVNPTAAKAGALWQKFIRRAAKIRFGDENAVVDIYATFVDKKMGSCGELSEWIDGRTWRLEVDDNLDSLKRWLKCKKVNPQKVGSPEYRSKKEFMGRFVHLLHDMGAHEFARQYEWTTCKSQPNCLKRLSTDDEPSKGLVAVDFRAGLVLLPFLPMSPGDFKLIWQGLKRGSIVQFDRGDIAKLESFVETHKGEFSDMTAMLDDLKSAEQIYRKSIPDVTHNHIRLFYNSRLWSTLFDSTITGWKTRNLLDEQNEQKLRQNKLNAIVFWVIGVLPLLGCFMRKFWGCSNWREHYISILSSPDYFYRALRGKAAETIIIWHRAGRLNSKSVKQTAESFWRFMGHLPLSILPVWLHRLLTDYQFLKEKLYYIFVRFFRLYFNTELREQWLRDMINDGKKKHILTDEDAETILSQLSEPYIQRYLTSLVVHGLTLPITQLVSLIIAGIYYKQTGDKLGAGGILILFQIIPISPGSIARGLYTVGIAVHDRSFKDYNIAVFLSFFKYIGYSAFPIQMTYHYPALARFMASHFATEIVHIVPVFGERGALLEHWVFRLFYNWPITMRRRMRKRTEDRSRLKPRYWHVGLVAVAGAALFTTAGQIYLSSTAEVLLLRQIWWIAAIVSFICGAAVTLGCGGATLWKRVFAALMCGILTAVLFTIVPVIFGPESESSIKNIMSACIWRGFALAILYSIGAIITEVVLPDSHLDMV